MLLIRTSFMVIWKYSRGFSPAFRTVSPPRTSAMASGAISSLRGRSSILTVSIRVLLRLRAGIVEGPNWRRGCQRCRRFQRCLHRQGCGPPAGEGGGIYSRVRNPEDALSSVHGRHLFAVQLFSYRKVFD